MRDDASVANGTTKKGKAIIERLRRYYDALDEAAIAQLGELYHAEVRFVDPIHEVQGLQALQDYFRHTMAGVAQCTFVFGEQAQHGQHAFVQWHMHLRHPKLAGGDEIIVPGVSQLEFYDDKIIFQRDYYDMGTMIYEQVPLLGYLTRKVKQRLVPA